MGTRHQHQDRPRRATLLLEDGSAFEGYSFGAYRSVAGEVVFNTGMVGYPESLTDPSYRGQILILTYPLIGNYGVPGRTFDENKLPESFESPRIQAEALVITNEPDVYSHWNARGSLPEWLERESVPGVWGIDTRMITKKLREQGTMLGKIISAKPAVPYTDPNRRNLVSEVSIKEPVLYRRGRKRVVIIDCGVKGNIIKAFLRRNITVMRVPWNYNIMKETCHGIVISNGPGDPMRCHETIENVRRAFEKNVPILGICLGSQILGLASGARTYKLKYGHRSQNQPCIEVGSKRCYITSQNHGYAIDDNTLSEDWRTWFYNNNDRTNEGIIHISKPFFGAQFHPEASPGPDDTEFLFDMFVRALD